MWTEVTSDFNDYRGDRKPARKGILNPPLHTNGFVFLWDNDCSADREKIERELPSRIPGNNHPASGRRKKFPDPWIAESKIYLVFPSQAFYKSLELVCNN